jgi:hypothetical protein
MPEAFVWNIIRSISLSQFRRIYWFMYITGSCFTSGLSSIDASRAWTPSSPIANGFRCTGVNSIRNRVGFLVRVIWRAINSCRCLWSIPFISDFAIALRAWGVTSQFSTSVSHRYSFFLPVIRLMALVTQLTAVLHAESQVTCHSFLKLCSCFSLISRPGRSLFRSDIVILPICRSYRGSKVAGRFVSFFPRVNLDSGWN